MHANVHLQCMTPLVMLLLCPAAESGVLEALEQGKSEEEALKLADAGAVASPIERKAAATPAIASPAEKTLLNRGAMYGFAARFLQ